MSVRRLAAAALLTLAVLTSVRAQGKKANKSIPIHPVKLKILYSNSLDHSLLFLKKKTKKKHRNNCTITFVSV